MVWLFLSNMFPSASDPSYGAFVARSLVDLRSEGLRIDHVVVLSGRHAGLGKLWRYLAYTARMLRIGIFAGVNSIYAHYASHHCLPIALLTVVFRKHLVLHIHGDDLVVRDGWSRRVNRFGQHWLIRHARLIVVPSAYFAEMLSQIHPEVPPERIVISPSGGVDVPAFREAALTGRSFWTGEPGAPVHLGYVGRIEEDKGWQLLIEAFELLVPEERQRLHLHFWGAGQQVTELQAAIERIGGQHAEYHGHVGPDEVPAVHARFDIHAVPSYRESLGLSAVEGLAAGHVVICTDIRPFTDFTADGISALHFRVGDSQSLAQALRRAMSSSPVELRSLCTSAQQVAAQFDRAVVARQLMNEIQAKVCAI